MFCKKKKTKKKKKNYESFVWYGDDDMTVILQTEYISVLVI